MAEGRAILALASIDGAEERKRLPDEAVAAIKRSSRLLAPLVDIARARQVEPSSASRIGRWLSANGRTKAADRLTAAALVAFPADISLRRDRLRLLVDLGHERALLRFIDRVLAAPSTDTELLWKIWRLVQDDPVLLPRARQRFEEITANSARIHLLGARIARRSGESALALQRYARAIESGGLSPDLHREALIDGSDLAFATALWPAAIDIVEQAALARVIDPTAPHIQAALALGSRNPRPMNPMPTLLADDLVDAVLPHRTDMARSDGVLMVANGLACGGMERVLATTTAALRARGHPPGLALSSFDPGDPGRSFFLSASAVAADQINRLDAPAAVTAATALLPPRWRVEAAALHTLVARTRPRIVHAWNDRLGLIAALSAFPAGAHHLLIHIHHMRPTRDPAEAAAAISYPAMLRRLAERPEVTLLFCAEAAARDYADWLAPRDTERFRVLHNGFPLPAVPDENARLAAKRRFGLPPGAPVILSLSRFEPVKQPLAWLDAAARIAAARPDARFLMVGDGELLEATRRHSRKLGLGRQVVFPGRIADTDRALAAADLIMMTSASEGLPNGAVEAQLAGIPLVGYDVGGIRETIDPGVTGRLVAANDPAALAQAALGWLADPAGRAHAGLVARETAARRFGVDQYVDALEQLYDEIGR